jgi:DNA-binding response OmpR family regulator
MTTAQTTTSMTGEDSEPIRIALTRSLRQAGFAVTAAATGSAVLPLVAMVVPL